MAKPTYIRGEILPPQSQSAFSEFSVTKVTSDEHLNLIATWLDDRFEIPGTRIRFGLDALIGWIPGIGDALAAVASPSLYLPHGNAGRRALRFFA